MKKVFLTTMFILSSAAFANDCHVIARETALTFAIKNDYASTDREFDRVFPNEHFEKGPSYMVWAWGDGEKFIVVNLKPSVCKVREVYLSQDDQD